MPTMSEHLRLELAAAHRRGHTPQPMPSTEILLEAVRGMDPHDRLATLGTLTSPPALDPGAPVPGCNCPECTGLPMDHPARIRTLRPHHCDGDMDRTVKEAKARPILDVAQGLGIEVRPVGRAHTASCPFHEDRTPSFSLSSAKNVWHCFSCGRGGDVIRLVMEMKRIAFVDAVRELAS